MASLKNKKEEKRGVFTMHRAWSFQKSIYQITPYSPDQDTKSNPCYDTMTGKSPSPLQNTRNTHLLLLIYLILAVSVIIITFVYYSYEADEYREGIDTQLQAVSLMKVEEISQWMDERLGDAAIYLHNPLFSSRVEHLLYEQADTEVPGEIRSWLSRELINPEYHRIFLLDTNGTVLISTPESQAIAPPAVVAQIPATLLLGNLTTTDISLDETGKFSSLFILVPIYDDEGDKKPLGVLVFQIDPAQSLYPALASWPLPGSAIATYLVRQEGGGVLYLNPSGNSTYPEASAGAWVSARDDPGVLAVSGIGGLGVGTSISGKEVLFHAKPVPGRPWYLVTQADREESYQPFINQTSFLIILVILLIIGIGAGIGVIWREQNSRYYQDLYESGRELEIARERSRQYLDAIGSIVVVLDREGTIVGINPAGCEAIRSPEAELIGKNWFDTCIPEEAREAERKTHQEIFWEKNPGPAKREGLMMTGDGEITQISWHITHVSADDGELPLILLSGEDITRNKQAESALLESEERHRILFEESRDAMVIMAPPDFRFYSLNTAAMQLFGLKGKDEAGSFGPWDFSPEKQPDGRISEEKAREMIDSAMKDGVAYFAWTHERRDGAPFPTTVLLSRVTAGGKPFLEGTIRDISALVTTEQKLKESEKNFRTFFESMGDMVFVGTNDGKILYSNPEASTALGYTGEELRDRNIIDLHPDDRRSEVSVIFQEMIQGIRDICHLPLVTRSGVQIPVETRIRKGRWNGEECFFGISKDLTSEVEATQRFERIFRNNPALMALTEFPQRIFVDVNEAFITTLGYSRDELLGRTPEDLELFPDWESYLAIGERLEKTGTISGEELAVRRKDGALIEGIFSGEIIVSQKKSFLLTVMLDITERKLLENELMLHEKELIRYSTDLALDITERKRVEALLKEKSEELDRYFTSSLDLLCIADVHGRFIRLNPEWEKVLGYRLSDLEGQSFIDLVHPDDREGTLGIVEKLKGQDEVLNFENRYRCSDGSYRWIEWRSKPHGETIYAVARDITDRKQADEEIREIAERLELATRAGNVGIWHLDVINDRLVWDPQMHALYGTNADRFEVTYRAWQDTLHPDDLERADAEIRMALSGEKEFDTEFRVVWPDGSIHAIRALAITERDLTGRPVHLTGTNWDITERKRAEAALQKANRQLNLLASITRHDINNKILVIRGYMEIILDMVEESLVKNYLQKIESAIIVIQNQIDFTRLYQGLGMLEPEWQELDRVLQTIHPPEHVTLSARVLGIEVYCDLMLKKVFENLLDNSLRHGEHVTWIRVSATRSDSQLVITWEDNGVGIPEPEKEKIFLRGYGKNTGLGMFLVREVLSLTDITITETGVPGIGARFEIRVPKEAFRTRDSEEEKEKGS